MDISTHTKRNEHTVFLYDKNYKLANTQSGGKQTVDHKDNLYYQTLSNLSPGESQKRFRGVGGWHH